MKKIVTIFSVLLLSMLLFCQHAVAAEDLKGAAIKKLQTSVIKVLPADSDIVRVAVLDFEGDDGTIKNAITSAVTEKTTFKVIERADLDKILEEQGLQLKDIMDEQTRITHGRIKGVQGILFGKVLSMDEGFLSYTIKVHLKLDDVEKGDILFSKDFGVTAVSPVRNWLMYGSVGLLAILILVAFLRGRRTTLVKEDISQRIDLTKEIDKTLNNISATRSKLNSEGKTGKAVMFSNLEGDLMHIKQVVQLAPRGNSLKTKIKDYKNVLEFDKKIIDSFEALAKSSDKAYDMVISGNIGDLEREVDMLKRDIKNIQNEFHDRGF